MTRIAILTLAIGDSFRAKVLYSHLSKIEYCKRHKYDFIEDDTVLDKTRPIAWSKILLILKYMSYYDYVVWVDADAMIVDLDQKIEDKIHLMNNKPVMVVNPHGMVNTGVILVKNDPTSFRLMECVYEQTQFLDEKMGPNWEQDAFIHVYQNDISGLSNSIEIGDFSVEKHIQTYLPDFYPGCFILHLAGFRDDSKNWTVFNVFKRFFPLKRMDETDDHYQSRMTWFNTRCTEDIRNFYETSPFAIIERN